MTQEQTVKQIVELESVISLQSGNIKISLCKSDSTTYYVAMEFVGHEITISPLGPFEEAHAAYIVGCLLASDSLRQRVFSNLKG